MKKPLFLKFVWSFFAISFFNACSSPDPGYLMYVGTYTGHGSEGIYAYRFKPENGELSPIGLVAKTDNPSFIAIDSAGRFLYAVNELDSFQNKPVGAISVFEINRKTGNLKLLQQISSLGAAPAHLSLDKSNRFLFVANYNGGNSAVFPIESDGRLGQHTAFIQDTGSSVNPERQSGPHAHFIQVTSDNNFIMIADLGIDKVLVYRFDSVNGLISTNEPGFSDLDPGSGPRHIAFASSGEFVYVLNELASTITIFSFESETGRMEKHQTISSLPENFTGMNTAAEIVIDAKGRYLYVSNRGDNSIGCFAVNPKDGTLTPVDWVSSGGKTPRNFEIDPTGQWLLAANQDSDNIVIFRIDQQTGKLKQVSDSIQLSSPVCIRFMITN